MPDFFDIAKKTMMTGIGFALKTKDEVEDWAKEFVTKGELSENEGEKFTNELLKRYEEARENMEQRIEKSVRDILKKLDVPSPEDIAAMKSEIAALKALVEGKGNRKE
ncbi:MAG: phasin family protein [Thermodesulfobacteriota bacterium]